ncbi:MAG: SBBP repeat-containing protein [Candidatus Manganitrophus sp. SA1]|nr:SBBP repeat-containing protein [Candidatus Manganitrophus morganii]
MREHNNLFRYRTSLRSICFFFLASFGIGLTLAPIAGAQTPTQAWVARYNGPGNGNENTRADSFEKKIAVDSLGNVYVTGYSPNGTNTDYATVKYDTNGNQLWVARYDNGGDDVAEALAIDVVGNVYVTGTSPGATGDTATIKYDANGNQLWAARYDNGGEDHALGVEVDAVGNVYITGYSFNGTYDDYLTIKYDQLGNLIWLARYDSGATPFFGSHAYSLTIDGAGNVYVTGTSDGGPTGTDYATVKYDANGNQLWASRYHNGVTEVARLVSVDSSGNVHVTGFSYNAVNPSDLDYATIKYDAGGNQLWVRRYDNGQIDLATGLAIDASGNAYVTGASLGANGLSDYATVKYDPAGNQVWVARFDGISHESAGANAVTVDLLGDIYVTGFSVFNGTSDYATVKYNPNGIQQWVVRYDNGSHDTATDVAVDAAGQVYVVGYSSNGANDDYATIKYVQVVVPVIGPPATLELTPPAAANTVGESHTVTATVKDALQQPTPGITVRFSVEGSVTASGAAVTDANGQAGFTYGGPQLPGADMIRAYADTDNNNVQDAGEPFGDATKAWLALATTSGQVTGGGQTQNATGTGQIAFGFNAKSDDLVNGNCNVVDRSISLHIKCSSVDSLTVSGTHATIFGMASDNGTETPFRIDVDDLGEPGRGRDTFRIITGTGYSAGGTLTGGNIQIHQ